jgi:perosamine synthetase
MNRPQGRGTDPPRETIAFLKRAAELDELLVRSIRFSDGWLIPLAELHRDDAPTIELLGRWRTAHMSVHPTQFTVTAEGTGRWLADGVLDHPDRIVFLVAGALGRPIGQLGFSLTPTPEARAILGTDDALELGFVIRGEPAAPGLMTHAARAALAWCREELTPSAIYALTFSDNERALAYFTHCGAAASGTIPLVRHEAADRIEYRPGTGPGEPSAREFTLLSFDPRPEPRAETDRIDLAGPSITPREASYALDAARRGWGARRSDYLERLSQTFAEAVGVRYALPTSSCTGAMHLALLTRGIGPGDEVIVPDLTWVATANAVALTGATPVFADVEPDSWGLAPDALTRAITERTRAVVPVHLYGYPARMPELVEIADAHGLFVLEDAAAAVGAGVAGRPVGSWGDMAAFSFQGAKVVVAGEGGMLVTDDEALFERARHLHDQARTGEDPFRTDAVTPKYKMANVQAALALAQTERLPWLIERKDRVHAWYREALAGTSGLQMHSGAPHTSPTHWMTSLILSPEARLSRDELIRALGERGIDTRPTFPSLSSLPMWSPAAAEAPVTAAVAERGLNLPSGVRLQRDEVERVGKALRGLLSAR